MLGEKKEAWSYYLNDGLATTRQMSDATGYVILSRSFTPWGELLELHGDGDFSWGYLGGLLDAATGLIYVGGGQYYDPVTGRFLTRGVYPGSPNPYIPWRGDPLGMIAGPLALLALVRGKRKASRIDQFLALGVILLALGATVAGCVSVPPTGTMTLPAPTSTPGPTLPPGDPSDKSQPTYTATVVVIASATSMPTQTLTVTIICTSTPTPLLYSVLDRGILRSSPRGEKFYDLYLAMVFREDNTEQPGQQPWWITNFAGDDGFSIWEFMEIMWGYDARLDLPEIWEAMHNRASAFCPGGCDPTTAEGSLLYMSVYVQSARDRVDKWQKGMDPAAPGVMDDTITDNNINTGKKIVQAVKTSNVDVKTLDGMAPYDYGNISLSPIYEKMVSLGYVLLDRPAPSGDTFFVLSKCQYNFAQDAKNKWGTESDISSHEEEFKDLYRNFCGKPKEVEG